MERGYAPVGGPSLFRSVTVAELKEKLTDKEWAKLLTMAHVVACLDGNAFPDLIEQYVVDAYNSLWANGWASNKSDDYDHLRIQNLYPMTNGEHWTAYRRMDMQRLGVDPDSPNAPMEYIDAWTKRDEEEARQRQSPPGLATIDEDGNPNYLIMADAPHYHLVVSEIHRLNEKFCDDSVALLHKV